MSDVFLSYANDDWERAHVVAKALEECGFSVWWDRKTLPGDRFREVIKRELDAASCVVVLWSAIAVGSEWVVAEASHARRRHALVPALLEDVIDELPLEFTGMQAASLVDWQGSPSHPEFQNLLAAVRRLTSPDQRAAQAVSAAASSSTESESRRQRQLHRSATQNEAYDRVAGSFNEPQPNEAVGRTIRCSGVVTGLQPGLNLWVVVEVGDLLWPKETKVLPDEANKWYISIFEDGVTEQFAVSLFVADTRADRRIKKWLEAGQRTGKYSELRGILGARRLARVDGLRLKTHED